MADGGVYSKGFKPSQLIDYTETLLSRRFPNRVVKVHPFSVPAFTRGAAGSDRGDSWGYLTFDKVIFANPKELGKKNSLMIAVGREKGRRDPSRVVIMDHDRNLTVPYIPQMSGIWRIVVPKSIAKSVVDFYIRDVRGQETLEDGSVSKAGINLWHALEEMVGDNFHHYSNVLLFGFDESIKNYRGAGLFKFKHGSMLHGFEYDLEPFSLDLSWGFWSYEEGIEFSSKLADRSLFVNPLDHTLDLTHSERSARRLEGFQEDLARLSKGL